MKQIIQLNCVRCRNDAYLVASVANAVFASLEEILVRVDRKLERRKYQIELAASLELQLRFPKNFVDLLRREVLRYEKILRHVRCNAAVLLVVPGLEQIQVMHRLAATGVHRLVLR